MPLKWQWQFIKQTTTVIFQRTATRRWVYTVRMLFSSGSSFMIKHCIICYKILMKNIRLQSFVILSFLDKHIHRWCSPVLSPVRFRVSARESAATGALLCLDRGNEKIGASVFSSVRWKLAVPWPLELSCTDVFTGVVTGAVSGERALRRWHYRCSHRLGHCRATVTVAEPLSFVTVALEGGHRSTDRWVCRSRVNQSTGVFTGVFTGALIGHAWIVMHRCFRRCTGIFTGVVTGALVCDGVVAA